MKKIAIMFGFALLLADEVLAQLLIQTLIWDYAGPIICGIFKAFVWIGGGLASVMFLYAGLKYLMSADDPAARKAAKDMAIHALIAIIIIVVAEIIVGLAGPGLTGCEPAGPAPGV